MKNEERAEQVVEKRHDTARHCQDMLHSAIIATYKADVQRMMNLVGRLD